MKLSKAAALSLAAFVGLSLTACGGSDSGGEPSASAAGSVDLTVSAWSPTDASEFQKLADAFEDKNPDIKISFADYGDSGYDAALKEALEAGQAPDIVTIRQNDSVAAWAAGKQLLDVSDVTAGLSVSGAASYTVDGAAYAVPYRQDFWVLYYNKDLFDAAGVAYPDGSWTWDDYAAAAETLTTKLAGKDAKGAYEESWQSTVQGFAQAQTPEADLVGGEDYTYLKAYYERAVALQNGGDQETFADVTAKKLSYESQFGQQSAAMMAMGSWYVAALGAQQASGEAADFAWGVAPAPQYDFSTAGLKKTPVTFGDPLGMAVNAKIDPAKIDAAKKWLRFVGSDEAGTILSGLGLFSTVSSDAVVNAYFAVEGVPSDDLSKFALSVHTVKPENPPHEKIAAIQAILDKAHTAIMTAGDAAVIDDEIAKAADAVKAELS
ncbi:MAG: extracellular solute-binding protein [Propionibacteriaceae bacterium]|jgi:multiple sugar transport system substrate-binding protein|nr:extracellular solute-binding protein [Propionibacteriaceae bacterium]